MAKTILTTGGIPTATTTNTIQYWPLAVTSIEAPATIEANKEIVHRTAGTLSKLYVKITANTINATSTINVRKNGANAGLSLTIGANATGAFENTVNTVSVVAGDKLNYQTAPGAATGSMSISILSVLFEASTTTDTVTRLTTSGVALNYTTSAVSRYNVIAGHQVSSNGSEIAVKCKIRKPSTGRNLAIYVSANARISNTDIKTRKNATDGACIITIGPGQTGWFEDNTHTDTLAVGDDYAMVVVTSVGGTEAITVQSTSLDLVTTSGHSQTFNGRSVGFSVNAAATHYFPIGGGTNTGTEISAQQKTRMPSQYSELVIHVSANTITADTVLRLRKNGADTPMTTTIPASAIGYFSDSTNTETFTDTDDISLQILGGATGTLMTVRSITLALSETVTPVIEAGSGGGSQGRSPLYRQVRRREPEIAIAIVRVRIPLQYEVERLSVQVKGPLLVPQKPIIKYASAVLNVIEHILPLPTRPTPLPPVQKIVRVSIPLTYEVTTLHLQLKAACSYEVDRLFTQEQQHKIVATSINFLLSDLL